MANTASTSNVLIVDDQSATRINGTDLLKPERHKTVRFDLVEVKADDDKAEAEFEGYASVFGNKDLGGDIVMPGAFKKTLDEQSGKVPLLADHKYTLSGRIGVSYCSEDGRGLKVNGFINLDSVTGRDVYSHMKHAQAHDVPLGMSFGYSIPKGGAEYDAKRGAQLLNEVILYETTITQFPMNPKAGVENVKATFDEYYERDLEGRLLDADYWAIQSARAHAIEDAVFFSDGDASERMEALDAALTAYHAAMLNWGARWLNYIGVKEYADVFEKARAAEREMLDALRSSKWSAQTAKAFMDYRHLLESDDEANDETINSSPENSDPETSFGSAALAALRELKESL